jgi:putative ABC transport system permease protein
MFATVSSKSVVVSEYTLYQLGVVDDEQVEEIIGKPLVVKYDYDGPPRFSLMHLLAPGNIGLTAQEEMTLSKISALLPEILTKTDLGLGAEEKKLLEKLAAHAKKPPAKPNILTDELIICGVMAVGATSSPRAPWHFAYRSVDLAIPARTAEEHYFHFPKFKKQGFERLLVEVDAIENVKAVNDQIQALGLETYSLVDLLDKEQFIYLLVFSTMTIVAVIALVVAALGITNTMLMSVLERVREIGIMKAVGARELHIQSIFLVEGGLVGLVGGLLGLLLGWAASFPADAWVASLVENRLHIKLEQSIFAFPLWLVVGVPLFACLVTTLAAYYPARRASRTDPIKALRHE